MRVPAGAAPRSPRRSGCTGTASPTGTRRRRCPPSCRPAGCRARAARARIVVLGHAAQIGRAGGRRSPAASSCRSWARRSSSPAAGAARRPLRSASSSSRHLVQEPRIDAGALGDGLDRGAELERALDLEDPLRRRRPERGEHASRASRPAAGRRPASAPITQPVRSVSSPRSPFWNASLKVRPIAIASPTDFICVVSVGIGRRELLEREARDLHHDVVEHRLERRRRGLGDVVGELVEPVAHGHLGADPRDRETRSPWTPAPTSARPAGSSR